MSRSPITSSTRSLTGARLALAGGAVDRDQHLRLGELHPLAHRLRGEAAEDDVVRRADPRAGEHRDDDLGDHRQVDPDDVALAARPSSFSAFAKRCTSASSWA